jgi:hypothetical protein
MKPQDTDGNPSASGAAAVAPGQRTGGGGAWPGSGGGGASGGRGFQIVRADEPLDPSGFREGEWVLTVLDGQPLAFLAPTAAARAVTQGCPSVLDYLRTRRAAYVADLEDYERIWDTALRQSDLTRSVVVLDERALRLHGEELRLRVPLRVGLFEIKCYFGENPGPNKECPECSCPISSVDDASAER